MPAKTVLDSVCPTSPTGNHYHVLPADVPRTASRLARVRVNCDFCRARLRVDGVLWVVDRYIITEEDHIEDLVGSAG